MEAGEATSPNSSFESNCFPAVSVLGSYHGVFPVRVPGEPCPRFSSPGTFTVLIRVMETFVISAAGVDGKVRTRQLRVHDREQCEGRGFPCVIHSPSDHHMVDWELNWRGDTGVMERLCPHGVGHPDPDHMTFILSRHPGASWHGVHGCDGCCREDEV